MWKFRASDCGGGGGRMLILSTINFSFKFNISFTSVGSFKLRWPFSSVDWSSAVDVTRRSEFKQKYMGCEFVLASQCTNKVDYRLVFSVHCCSSFSEKVQSFQ